MHELFLNNVIRNALDMSKLHPVRVSPNTPLKIIIEIGVKLLKIDLLKEN